MSTDDELIPAVSADPVIPAEIESDQPEPAESNETVESDPPLEESKNPPLEESKKYRIFLESLTPGTISDLIQTRQQVLGEEGFAAAVAVPNSYDAILIEYAGAHGLDSDRMRDSIDSISDKSKFANKLVINGKTVLGSMKPKKSARNGAVISGPDALAAFAIQDGWLKRVALYNSGFSIDIVEPTLVSLNTFFTKAHDATNGYGRQFGGLFFYFHDLMIKEALVELILPLIINSTLHNANRNNNLLRSIKLVDLKMILNTIGAMMYPDGFNYTHVCANPAGTCTHHEETLIDISKLAMYDFSKMSDDCIKHMAQATDVTPEALTVYHKKLGFDGHEIRFAQYGFVMKVPSLNDHLEYGRQYNADLLSSVFVSNPDSVMRSVMFSYYQIYTPFVDKLNLYVDDELDVTTSDKTVITQTLLRLQSEDKDGTLIKDIDAFIAKSEIGYVCYPTGPCPMCNYVPGSGFYTVDPILAFFIQSLMKLNQN